MSIFRTVKKIVDCDVCHGLGMVTAPDGRHEITCLVCEGSGRVERLMRASAASVNRAEQAIPAAIPPGPARKAAKARLRNEDPEVASTGAGGKVGKGYVDEG